MGETKPGLEICVGEVGDRWTGMSDVNVSTLEYDPQLQNMQALLPRETK